jgi:hypothetical protein
MVLREVESGRVEIVFNGLFSTLQFNCSCEDALPYCKAMCCRMRVTGGATTTIDEDEKDKFRNVDGMLMFDETTRACVYLDGECNCTVHLDKPRMCRAWHCSPKGVGDGITIREAGWLLAPMVIAK